MKALVIEKRDLIHNIKKIKEIAEEKGKDDNGNDYKIIAVVKSNGYGLRTNRILKATSRQWNRYASCFIHRGGYRT